ncbi:MAG: ribosome recycling factor [Proteobacteria bacterium]|nr:ribosome recycling factor [Pseudomonadota bacterium]
MATALDDLKRRMDMSLDTFKKELGGLRTGRASPNMLDPVVVDAYGSHMPLNQVGTVSVPEARLLTVQVWDKGLVKSVEKAITDAGLGLNPQPDGQLIRIPIPSLTAERRQELSKVAGKYAEGARVAIRNVRRDGMEQIKKQLKDKAISEDEEKNLQTKIQQLTDGEIKKIDEMLTNKEKEITQV